MYFCMQEDWSLTHPCVETLCYLLSRQLFLCNKQQTEVTITIKCNILDTISVCFVFDGGSLSCQMCFRKQVLSLLAQANIRDVSVPNGRLFLFFKG